MAIRQLRYSDDPLLRKKSREVKEVTERIEELMDDMIETMKENDGVGLAAPQVGILRRVIVVDDGSGPIKLINPEIIEESGCQEGVEGCLSVPNKMGQVRRPDQVKVSYINDKGEEDLLDAEGFLARILCHEIDHLNGILFIDVMDEEVLYKDIEED